MAVNIVDLRFGNLSLLIAVICCPGH